MGAIAESMTAYVQPLLDTADGSMEQMNRAFELGQICWNLALMPEEARNEMLCEMQTALGMDAETFEEFRRTVVFPMILRHEQMFSRLHGSGSMGASKGGPAPAPLPVPPVSSEKYPGTGRNAPCPCNSGRKYKKCCGG